ncbi:SH3 domain-containing protein [Patulibacter minatonensis]|uniref:SH3 domain-containing protein n=1 Tax=Patulibacter minatonensis TaxID=298163 RepID=UPI0012FCC72D|nr:SH3 domain-containing protein [Patulibacter minatonensis]
MSRSRLAVSTAATAVLLVAAGSADAAPAPVSLSVTQPTTSVPRLQLTAKASAATRSVVFRGRWKGADGVVRTRRLGVDEVASNGFAIGWDASRVPRATQVSLTVQARDATGRIRATSTVRTWRSPGKAVGTTTETGDGTSTGTGEGTGSAVLPAGGVAGTIVGECPKNGTCTVAVRSTPGTAAPRVAALDAGTKVTVQCRTTGQTVTTPSGTSSTWIRIGTDRWVFAPYVEVSPKAKIPTCAA